MLAITQSTPKVLGKSPVVVFGAPVSPVHLSFYELNYFELKLSQFELVSARNSQIQRQI